VNWTLNRLAGFDTETSGINVETDRIVTACLVQCGGGQPTVSRTWVSDADGIDIPDAAARIHGYDTARVRKEGTPAAQVIGEMVAALAEVQQAGIPIVAMNASFDLTLADREARRHGVNQLTDLMGETGLTVIDPMVIDRQMSHRSGRRTLTDLCAHYEVRLDGAHTADADAIAACRVAWRLGQRYPQVGGRTVAELHAEQVEWAAAQARSRAAYFARTPGKEHLAVGVREAWPLVPFAAAEGATV
jgi:DNA polymerase-3 subunit epsilon